MICLKCGKSLSGGEAACPICGTPVARPAQPQATPYQQPVQQRPPQPMPNMGAPMGVPAQQRPVQPAPNMGMQQQRPVQPAPNMGVQQQRPVQPAPYMGMQQQRPVQPAPNMGVQQQRPVQPAPNMGVPPQPVIQPGAGAQTASKSRTGLIVGIVAGAVALILVIVLVIVLGGGKKSDELDIKGKWKVTDIVNSGGQFGDISTNEFTITFTEKSMTMNMAGDVTTYDYALEDNVIIYGNDTDNGEMSLKDLGGGKITLTEDGMTMYLTKQQ